MYWPCYCQLEAAVNNNDYDDTIELDLSTIGVLVALTGVSVVLAKLFARLHQANLVNWENEPLQFELSEGYDALAQGDKLQIAGLRALLAAGRPLVVTNRRAGALVGVKCTLSARARHIVLASGLLAQARASGARPAQAVATI